MSHKVYISSKNKEYYVRQEIGTDLYYCCDTDGIAKGEDLEHIGDSFKELSDAKFHTDFYASGGHWVNYQKAWDARIEQ